MYFLGIDPSTKATGYCVMNENKDLIEYGVVDISKVDDHGEKIAIQYTEIEKLLKKYSFSKILCEDQFAKTNIDTLKKLSRTTGAYLLLGYKYGVNIETIYPTSWRKIFHGNGRAKKETTFEKVCVLYDFEGLTFKKHNDLTDSIGIAWAAVDIYKGVEAA